MILASAVILARALCRIMHLVEQKKELMLNKRLMIAHSTLLALIIFVDFFVMALEVIVASHERFGWLSILNMVYFVMNTIIQFIVIGIFRNISNSFKPNDSASSDDDEKHEPLKYDIPRFIGENGETLVAKMKRLKADDQSSNSSKSTDLHSSEGSSISAQAKFREAIFNQFF